MIFDNIEIGDDAESMVNFEENLIKEYTANTVNKEDNTDANESDEEDGKESTQSKQNQCTIKSYGESEFYMKSPQTCYWGRGFLYFSH